VFGGGGGRVAVAFNTFSACSCIIDTGPGGITVHTLHVDTYERALNTTYDLSVAYYNNTGVQRVTTRTTFIRE